MRKNCDYHQHKLNIGLKIWKNPDAKEDDFEGSFADDAIPYELSGKYNDHYIIGDDDDYTHEWWLDKFYLPYVFHQLLETKKISFTKNDNLRDIFDNSILPAINKYVPQVEKVQMTGFEYGNDGTISYLNTNWPWSPSADYQKIMLEFSNFKDETGKPITSWSSPIGFDSFTANIATSWKSIDSSDKKDIGKYWPFSVGTRPDFKFA